MIIEKPEIVEEEHLEYLDELRESGVTNMLGSGPYLESTFSITKDEARVIAFYWMKSFGERNKS